MSLGKRLFIGEAAADDACTTDTVDIFGDSSGVALYSLDYDASDTGGNHDGTPTDVTFGVDGQINWGASFNGSSSYIEINKSIFGTGDGTADVFTISLWFNTTTNNGILAGTRGNSATQGFILWLLSDGTIRYDEVNATGSVDTLITTNTYDDGNWHNVVVTRNASNQATLYVDGSVQVATTTITTALTSHTNNLFIGRYSAGSLYYDGLIDQVRIFQKSLSSSEVSTLYAETACVYTPTTDTIDYQGTNEAYYKLNGNALDETSNNHDGNEYNITYEFGRFGNAAVFNGSSSRIQIASTSTSPLNISTGTFSISMWVNMDNLTNNNKLVYKWGSTAPNRNFLFTVLNSSGYLYFIEGTTGGDVLRTGTFALSTNTWHHITLTRQQGGSLKMYVDGDLKDTFAATGTFKTSTETIYLGYQVGQSTNFTGSIDQVRIFDSALDATAVENLYNEKQAYITKDGSDPFGDNSEVAFYKMENNANDSTGSNDGTPETNFTSYTTSAAKFGTYGLYGRGDGGITNTSLGTAFRGQTTLSLSAWFRGQNTTYRQTIFSFSDTNDGSTDLWIGIVAGNNTLGFRNVNNGSNNLQVNATGGSNVMDGKWHHVVFTADSGGTHIYVDGFELTGFSYSFGNSSTNIVMPNDLNQFNIGVNEDSGGFEWNWNDNHHISGHKGYLDQIRVFNRALDGDEVFQLWAEHIN